MSKNNLTVADVLKAGGKIPPSIKHHVSTEEADQLALRILGMLSEASNNATRRRAIEKARRMIGRR